jgi:hypothetical protein
MIFSRKYFIVVPKKTHFNFHKRIKYSNGKPKHYAKRRNRQSQVTYHRKEKDKANKFVLSLAFYCLLLAILWFLQIPKEVVYALLLIAALSLIPSREKHTELFHRFSPLLIFITFLVAVLSFRQKEALQILSYIFSISPK